MSIQGFLVNINGVPTVVQPHTTVTEKHGVKQFWFYQNHKSLLATKKENDVAFTVKP